MSSGNQVISRTEKGLAELKQRSHTLPTKLRSLLFLIENDSDATKIIEKAHALGGDERMLQQLIDQGLVTVNPSTVAVSSHNLGKASEKTVRSPGRDGLA